MRLLTIVTLTCAMVLQVFGADDPFTGTWKLELAKSKLPPPAPRSQTTHIQAEAENIRIVADGINDKGQPFKVTVSAGFGATTYAVMDSPDIDTVSLQRADSHTVTAEARKAGSVVGAGTAVVSKNGRTLKITFFSSDAKGKEIKGVAVLEKQ